MTYIGRYAVLQSYKHGYLVIDWVSDIGFLWAKINTWNRLNKVFLHFFWANFDDFSKFCSAFCTLHFEKSSKIIKNLAKMNISLAQLAFIPLLKANSKIQNRTFKNPIHNVIFLNKWWHFSFNLDFSVNHWSLLNQTIDIMKNAISALALVP